MKKLAALCLVILLIFCAAACSKRSDSGENEISYDVSSVEENNSEDSSVSSESEIGSGGSEAIEDSESSQDAGSLDGGNEPVDQDPVDPPEFLTTLPIPSSLTAPNTAKHGSVETITYETKVYDINGNGTGTVEKRADVYLPYGYDPDDSSTRYNVLYLMHGGGETYTYWLTQNRNTVNMLDNMFASGKAEPCIVVAPTFYTGTASGMDSSATDVFRWEFRNDLVPTVEAAYNTYAHRNGSTAKIPTSRLVATREHRGFAGLSMGSMVSIRSILIGCLDICAYINSMSGGYDANDSNTQTGFNLIKESITETFKNYPIKYWFNHNGTNDMALAPHENLKGMILSDGELSDYLQDDVNYKWIKFQGGAHDYTSWIVGTYNCLLVFFK